MEKIRELLQKSGLSSETADQICESLDRYTAGVKTQCDEEFQARLAKAKQVCLEETEAHKVELSRRLQIFLETKGPAIEEAIARQAANRETEAEAKLEKITALVEGVQLDGQSNSELQAELTKLKKVATHLLEERDHAIQEAKRLQSISERLVTSNSKMQKALAESDGNGTTKSIEETRKGGKPRTTRPTLTENVDPTPPPPAAGPDKTGVTGAPRTPQDIAETMEEVV